MRFDAGFFAGVALGATVGMVGALVVCSGFAASEAKTACVSDEDRVTIRRLAIDGIDAAFRKHVEGLFDVWMKDLSDQPRRARVGMQNGINAYARARAYVVAWTPEVCSHRPTD